MIPDIKKILYTTDMSENARYAFGYAVSLANRYGAGITLLHVLTDLSPYRDSLMINILGEEKWKSLMEANKEKIIHDLKDELGKFCDTVSAKAPACSFITDEIVVKIGNPVDLILEQAEKMDCDLLVMGTHGHGILGDAMIGSVSRRVVQRCKKPVLLVRLPKKKGD
jgi:nucleotide-binding universal stress UspA family protein